ncbi:acyl-CoA dehydrogenase C-terminal domain-containing protein [Ruegeria jejuensis]|uniref:acyl-CoA dehydrogenase C-terminal domain-containing protein n=1 Tax=Ruegeria jejuensis TaxID=3233338 RepID=UPI00355BCDEC
MPHFTAPVDDAEFLLHDIFRVTESDIPGYEDLESDFTTAVLNEAGKLASDVFAPINQDGDQIGCKLENGQVFTAPGFREGFDALRDGGWTGLDMPEEYGGQNLPFLMLIAVNDFLSASNVSLIIYQVLTHGAAQAILAHGTEQQKQTYLPKMISAEWTGTMNLTEPHCGTDLGLLRTRAEPQADGTYKISGQKIFISAGEHDLSDNIIHLVLARLPDAPTGVKGISLFIVPKYVVDENGNPGERNGVSVGSIEEKMGLHGNATCVMNYDGATGYLLGDAHKGMRAMFTMMNEARVSTALQGVSLGEAAYQAARDYALDRLQGRDVTGAKNPEGPADPLIVHPDVRRNLLEQKSFAEGGRALAYWAATLIDRAHRNNDAEADALVSLLTPVMKGFLSDVGFDMTIQAQQILGGHGYIEEWGMSQFARDARIAQIYEGANGIHALDLVARKMPANGGQAMREFFSIVGAFIAEHKNAPEVGEAFIAPLADALNDLQSGAAYFAKCGMGDINSVLSGSYDYMHLFGHVCLGYMWARQAVAATQALAVGQGNPAFYKAKLKTARFYMMRQLPKTKSLLIRSCAGAEPVMDMTAEEF